MKFVSGLLYEYYNICKRKAWYSANGISLEGENENVQIGRLIDENSYSRERKHVLVDDNSSIDFLRDNTVYEIKKSSAEKDAAIAQIKYYLYVLKEKGVEAKGELRVPKENLIESVILSNEDIENVRNTITRIEEMINSTDVPPCIINRGICMKCAYFEFCYI